MAFVLFRSELEHIPESKRTLESSKDWYKPDKQSIIRVKSNLELYNEEEEKSRNEVKIIYLNKYVPI